VAQGRRCARPTDGSVCLDDRPADREPHAHSTGLVVKRHRTARRLIFIEPDTRVLHGHENESVRRTAIDDQVARPIPHPFARLDAVHQQLRMTLLQLDPIALDRRQRRGQFGPEPHAVLARLAVQSAATSSATSLMSATSCAVRLLHQRTDRPITSLPRFPRG